MIIIKQTVNKNRSFFVRFYRSLYVQTLVCLCNLARIKYQVRKRVRC